jgi:glycosyltransferase involved in cell wall biosynthesis
MYSLVSIVLCSYNGEQFLIPQLDSLVQQSYSSIEIIVVDNCSSDGSVVILDGYKEKRNLVIYQNQENLGFLKNLKKQFKIVRGNLLLFLIKMILWKHIK